MRAKRYQVTGPAEALKKWYGNDQNSDVGQPIANTQKLMCLLEGVQKKVDKHFTSYPKKD